MRTIFGPARAEIRKRSRRASRRLDENLRDAFRLMAMEEVPQDYKTKQIVL